MICIPVVLIASIQFLLYTKFVFCEKVQYMLIDKFIEA